MAGSFLIDQQYRKKCLSSMYKKISWFFRGKANSIPIFIFGKQRSGTNMLMDIFRLHPDTKVVPESVNNEAFVEFRIRSLDTLSMIVEKSKEQFICFTLLMDSQRIKEFMAQFPRGKFIWVYRDYRDNANSAIRQFSGDDKKIDDIFSQQKHDKWKWFHDGISSTTLEHLKAIYSQELSEFDLACLVWWVRNRICIELESNVQEKIVFLKYEELVGQNSQETFRYLCEKLGMRYVDKATSLVHNKSIKKNPYPELDSRVHSLCEELMQEFDTKFFHQITQQKI